MNLDDANQFSLLVTELVARAKQLGLVWTLRAGEMVDNSAGVNDMRVVEDGDTAAIRAISMVGNIGIGTRVWVVGIPPAGHYIVGRVGAGAFPGERIATEVITENSAVVTTVETAVASVTAKLAIGRTYRVRFAGVVDTSVALDLVDVRLRENSAGGTEMNLRRRDCPDATGRWPIEIEAEYTAALAGDKTFVVTYVRVAGAGNIILLATATTPSHFYVDYIRG